MLALDHRTARQHLNDLPPQQRLAILHLFSCGRCRDHTERELVASLRELLAPPAPRLLRSAPRQAEIQSMGASLRAGGDLANLVAELPLEKVPGAVAAAVAADSRLRSPLAATTLLIRADKSLDDPCLAERLGEAAFAIVSTLDADRTNSAWLLSALWTILRSRLAQGSIERAEDAYRRALPFLAAAPGTDDGRSGLLAGLAQLRWAQRRLDEAAALFIHAARSFGDMGERPAEVACRSQAGFVLLEQSAIPGARAQLALAHLHLEAELAPALGARIALALAWSNLALGRGDQARERLRAARGLYDRAPGAAEETCRDWWEARIAALDGQTDRADSQLDAVRRRLFAEGSLGEAARSTVDLLDLRVSADRLDALAPLGHELLEAFGHHGAAVKPRTIIDVLASLAVQRSPSYRPALVATQQYLLGLRYLKGRADFIPPVQRLADSLLRFLRRGFAISDYEPLAPTEPGP